MRLRYYLATLFLLAAFVVVRAQAPLGIAYYDIDRLYDTVPALFYNDTDYTPQGKLHWQSTRYDRKVAQIAATIDSLALPLVALWGVENEEVARNIAARCCGDYSYLHRTLNSFNGMDFALFYYGDRFYPDYEESGRGYLYIEGAAGVDTLGLLLCSDERMAEWVVRDLRADRPGVRLIVMGRSARLQNKSHGLRDATQRAAQAGHGTCYRHNRWQMRDRIWVDEGFEITYCDVFIRPYLLDSKQGTPLPTYYGSRYKGGTSRSLPVYVYIK